MGTASTEKIVLRLANVNDLPAIAGLEKACFSDPWSAETIQHDFVDGPGQYWVAVQGEEVCGYFCLWFVADEVQLVNIAVHPDQQGQGIGSSMMEKVIREAKDRQAVYLFLEVRESNEPAIHLYEKYGLELRAKKEKAYSSPAESGRLMALDLGERA